MPFKTKLKDFLKKNKFACIVFALSAVFFILQKASNVSWDYSVYFMNAKYLFFNGSYFEALRPVFPSLIFGILMLFGQKTAEYLYILFVSSLFFFSFYKLSERLKIDFNVFYILAMSPFFLVYGISNGTEMLNSSLIALSVYFVLKEDVKSSIFSAFAAITRYQSIFFAPFLLLYKEKKKIIYSIILFLAFLMPYFAFNYYFFGNPLASFADNYLLNVQSRSSSNFMNGPFYILLAAVFYLPLFFLKMQKIKWTSKENIIMIYIAAITLILYFATPAKEARYLYNLIIPLCYFSAKSIAIQKKTAKYVYYSLIILGIAVCSLFYIIPFGNVANSGNYYKFAAEEAKSMNISECSIMSNAWVFLNYYGVQAMPAPHEVLIDKKLNENQTILLFRHIKDPYYSDEFFSKYQNYTIYDKEGIIILSKGCDTSKNKVHIYLNEFNEIYHEIYSNYKSIGYCDVLFKNSFINRLCMRMNNHG